MGIRLLPLTYRQTEVGLISRYIRAGDSCSVIGVSGIGKSNLFQHLRNTQTRQYYLGSEWQTYLFLSVDSNALGEISERSLYNLLLFSLVNELQRNGEPYITSRVEQLYQQALPLADPLFWQHHFVQAVQVLMTFDGAGRLIFLFDQFDEIYKTLNPHVFSMLRALRDEHKYRLSYLVFTREELPYIRDAANYDEFYELFSPNQLGLGPYNHDDALLLLAQTSKRYGQPLPAEICERLILLTGGHPGFLKAAHMALLNDAVKLPADNDEAVNVLLEVKDVYNESVKLWKSISVEERDALHHLSSGGPAHLLDAEVRRRLQLKGLIRLVVNQSQFFCPLLTKYAARQKISQTLETKIQAGPIRIDTAGEVWISETKVSPPLSKKEIILLEYLCLEPGRLRSKDEIVAVVYPDEYRTGAPVSDDALSALIKRLREHIMKASNGRDYIATVRGKGYRLDILSHNR